MYHRAPCSGCQGSALTDVGCLGNLPHHGIHFVHTLCVHSLRHVPVIPPEPVQQKFARFGNERVGRRCLRHLVETLIILGHHVARTHLRMEEHAVQMRRLNLAARRGPVFAWVQKEQGADFVKGQVVLAQLGGQIRVVGQVLLNPLIGGADVGETLRGRDLHLGNLFEGQDLSHDVVEGAARYHIDVMDERVGRAVHPAGYLHH